MFNFFKQKKEVREPKYMYTVAKMKKNGSFDGCLYLKNCLWNRKTLFGINKSFDHWTERKDKAMLFAEYISACGLSNKIDGTKVVMIKV